MFIYLHSNLGDIRDLSERIGGKELCVDTFKMSYIFFLIVGTHVFYKERNSSVSEFHQYTFVTSLPPQFQSYAVEF